ncbi:MFS transporter [Marinomonas piezotolerans]|uniref:MFS transporter n=1 Tax=Marinomonas piezotolerans TaxID=2213058 RepID=A0A370U4B2_9GAMM|nr:MFS transporter [Marinomonas piezotolerans]RDL42614.1 MFS transporter [Marinomonas piezotolerans]
MSNPHQPVPQTHWLEVLILWLAGVSAAMQFAKFSISYNGLLDFYQAGPTLTGAAISLVGVVGLIFGVTAGMLAGRIGYRKVLIGALVLGAALSFTQSLLPSFELILITRLLEGFSQLGVVVAAPTMIAKLSAPQHRSITMGLWGTFFGVAFAISGFAGKSILNQYNLSGLYLAHGLFIASMAVILLLLLKNDESRYGDTPEKDGVGYFKKLGQIYSTPRTVLPGIVFLFYTCTLVSLLTYIPNFIASESLRTSMQVILPLMSTAGTFIAGALSQYLMRPQRVAQLAYLGLAAGALLLSQFKESSLLFTIIVSQMVLCAGLIPGAALSMIPKLARNSQEQANGYGLLAQMGNLGATIGPPSFATVIALFGIYGLVGLVLVICTLGSIAALVANHVKAQAS